MLEIGWISKVHGVKGDVVVHALSNIDDRFVVGVPLILRKGTDSEERVVTKVAPYGKDLLLHFEGVDDRSAAEALKGSTLLGEEIDYGDELLVHELIGAQILEVDGTERGRVVAVQANPAADLLVNDAGALIPLTFVERFDKVGAIVTIQVPEGLFDL